MKSRSSGPMEQDVERFLGRAGGLLPTTESEVRRAEEDAVEFDGELPAGLAAYRPPGAPRPRERVVSLDERRERKRASSILSHAAIGVLSAAAAAAIVYGVTRRPPETPRASKDPFVAPTDVGQPTPSPSAAVRSIVVEGVPCASSVSECPSGRTCVPTSIAEISENRYRLRVGDFAPTELGKEALSRGPIDICARVGTSELACRPGRLGESNNMIVLPLTFSGAEGLAGVTVDVRFRGASVPLGQWSGPLGLSAKGLCSGQLVEPLQAGGDKLGTVSLFADDATYVEVGRAASTDEAEAMRARFDTPLAMELFETTADSPDRFALVFGPVSTNEAERIRWAVNDGGGRARVTLGADFVGAPRPLR